MDVVEILQWVLVAASVPIVVALGVAAVRRARALSERIEEYHEEQEAQKDSPGPVDPYQSMSELFGPPPPDDGKRGR